MVKTNPLHLLVYTDLSQGIGIIGSHNEMTNLQEHLCICFVFEGFNMMTLFEFMVTYPITFCALRLGSTY